MRQRLPSSIERDVVNRKLEVPVVPPNLTVWGNPAECIIRETYEGSGHVARYRSYLFPLSIAGIMSLGFACVLLRRQNETSNLYRYSSLIYFHVFPQSEVSAQSSCF